MFSHVFKKIYVKLAKTTSTLLKNKKTKKTHQQSENTSKIKTIEKTRKNPKTTYNETSV